LAPVEGWGAGAGAGEGEGVPLPPPGVIVIFEEPLQAHETPPPGAPPAPPLPLTSKQAFFSVLAAECVLAPDPESAEVADSLTKMSPSTLKWRFSSLALFPCFLTSVQHLAALEQNVLF